MVMQGDTKPIKPFMSFRQRELLGSHNRPKDTTAARRSILNQVRALEAEYPVPRPRAVKDRIRSLRAKAAQ
jgi:hypothetical protein